MTRKMSIKLKSPLKILLALVVAVSLFLVDFAAFESSAYTYEDYYNSSSRFSFYWTDCYLPKSYTKYTFTKLGTYSVYVNDSSSSSGMTRKYSSLSIYQAVDDETGSVFYTDGISSTCRVCLPFLYEPNSEAYIYETLVNKINSGNLSVKEAVSADIDAQTQVLLAAIENSKTVVDPLAFNFFPKTTELSYSQVAGFLENPVLTVRSYGCTVPVGSSGEFCSVYFDFGSSSLINVRTGSYAVRFRNFFYDDSGVTDIPSVLRDSSKSAVMDVSVGTNGFLVDSFDYGYLKDSAFICYRQFYDGTVPFSGCTLIVLFYCTESVSAFSHTFTTDIPVSVFRADSNVMVDALINSNNQLSDVMHGYDSTAGDTANGELSGILSNMEAAENETFLDSQQSIGAYTFTDILNFSGGLMSGLSLIYTFANGFFLASGDLSVIVSVLYCMAFLAIILGLWRFFRGS